MSVAMSRSRNRIHRRGPLTRRLEPVPTSPLRRQNKGENPFVTPAAPNGQPVEHSLGVNTEVTDRYAAVPRRHDARA